MKNLSLSDSDQSSVASRPRGLALLLLTTLCCYSYSRYCSHYCSRYCYYYSSHYAAALLPILPSLVLLWLPLAADAVADVMAGGPFGAGEDSRAAQGHGGGQLVERQHLPRYGVVGMGREGREG